jgi:hypothetical protein
VKESAPSETEEEPNGTISNASVRGEKDLWIMVRTWANWNFIREPLGTSWP